MQTQRTGSVVAPGAGRALPGILFTAGAYVVKPRRIPHTQWMPRGIPRA